MNTRKSLESLTLELSESLPTSCGFNLYFQAVFKGFQWTALLNKGVEGRNNERFYH